MSIHLPLPVCFASLFPPSQLFGYEKPYKGSIPPTSRTGFCRYRETTMKRAHLFALVFGVLLNSVFAAHADKRADELLKQTALKSQSVYALTANIEEESMEGGKVVRKKGTVRLLKPNYYRVVWEG